MRSSGALDIANSPQMAEVVSNPGKSFNTQGHLEAELADARLLHRLSIELIQEDGIAGLYEKIVQAAVTIMRSQYGTIQMLYPHEDSVGKLRLLACSGFTPEAENYWQWVYPTTGSTCGEVLRTGKRVIVPDYRACGFMQGEPTLQIFLDGGIFAAQSTPLISRTGKLVGMISTHWDHPYDPPQAHLELLDILARQASDLIERTQAAQALRESEERLRALANATNDVIYRMSPDLQEMYQLDGRNFLSDTGARDGRWIEKYILPEDQQEVISAIQHAVQHQTVFQVEHRVLKANGTVGWVFSRAIPIFSTDGIIAEWFGAASDITEKKSMLTTLKHAVEERTRELQRSNDDLQQFAHVASHDLKEPVRKIRTYGLRLQNELASSLNQRSREYTEKILESASRMSTMIEGVLTYSSFNALEQKNSAVDLNKILIDITTDLEMLIEQKKAIIHCSELPEIEGVEVLIYQLFYNLINNSLKFTKASEPSLISIHSETFLMDGTAYARVVIKDNGIGFESDYNSAIFDPFARLNPKTTYDGTGLGLSLSKKIVERHGGTIEASGSKDVGAVFTIVMPVKQPNPLQNSNLAV